jgi:hypothetical protein
MGNTTCVSGNSGAGFALAKGVWGHNGSSFQPAKFVFGHNGSGWICRYSVLSASSSGGSHTDSGTSSSGTASVVAGVTGVSGNAGSLSYIWSRLSGSLIGASANIAQPTWSYAFSGVANGTTSSTVSESFRCTITDGQTGAAATQDITVSLAWQNTIPAFSGSENDVTTLGPGSINPPAGANTVTVYIVAGGGRGGSGQFLDGDHEYGGGGGGSGDIVTWAGAAQSFSYSVGGTRSNSFVNGIGTASAGVDGGNADGADGAGGNDGTSGSGGIGGAGGGGRSTPAGTYGAGGNGGNPFEGGHDGQQGVIVFVWSP